MTVMDENTVITVLDLMDDEMIFEWSYRLRTDTRPGAAELYALVRGYLEQVYAASFHCGSCSPTHSGDRNVSRSRRN